MQSNYENHSKTYLVRSRSQSKRPLIINDTSGEIPKWTLFAVHALTALLYSRTLLNDFAGLDDDKYILNNLLIRQINWNTITTIFSSFFVGFYQPFVLLSYLFEYKLFGLNPLPYHLTNVMLHLVNIALVYKLSEQLSGKKMTALVVSLLFALHPMHVESVAWVTERKDVLYTVFYLSSLLVYLQYYKSGFRLKHYVAVLLLFVASLLSKSAAVTLPILLIAIDIYKGRKINTKSLLEKVPFLLLSIFFGILSVISQKTDNAVFDISSTFSVIDRIFLLTYAVTFYLIKFVIPLNLSAMHYYPDISNGALPWLYYASLPFLLLLAWLILRNNFLRKEIMFGSFFFLITISVMLQIFPVGRTITSERFSYVAYIGLFYIVGQYVSTIHKMEIRKVVLALFALFIIVFSIQTWYRIGDWKNAETLFTDIIKKNPDNSNAYLMRGAHRAMRDIKTRDLKGAIEDVNMAINLEPDMDNYGYRGIIKMMQNDYKGAIADFDVSLRLTPGDAKVYYNRGASRLSIHDTLGACNDWKIAKELGHGNAGIQFNALGCK